MLERSSGRTGRRALTSWLAVSALVMGACAAGPEPITGPSPALATPEEPAVEPLQVDIAVYSIGVEPLAEDPAQPAPVGEDFEGPTDEEIDLALHRLLGADPIGIVQRPEDAAPRLPLEMNDRVGAWINYFQNVIHDRFALYLQRKGAFEPMIRRKLR